jgi:predicted Rossmann fold flavoprotein
MKDFKLENAKKNVINISPFTLPKRIWEQLVLHTGIQENKKWADINAKEIQSIASELVCSNFLVNGKSTFKDEFVTAGGIDLKEIDFKTMQSKVLPNVYFAGEIMNIDAITGGFNFQNAWTSAFIVAHNI